MNVIKIKEMHFKHKYFMRCLTCILGNWLSMPMKLMTIFNLLDDASLGMTILVLSSFCLLVI